MLVGPLLAPLPRSFITHFRGRCELHQSSICGSSSEAGLCCGLFVSPLLTLYAFFGRSLHRRGHSLCIVVISSLKKSLLRVPGSLSRIKLLNIRD